MGSPPNPQMFGAAVSSRSLAVTAQRRINAYYDYFKAEEQDRAAVSIWCRPGLVARSYFGASPCRGQRVVPPYRYAVYGATVYKIDAQENGTVLGALLTSTGPVYMEDNGTQVMIVDPSNGTGFCYQIFGASAATGQLQGTFAQITTAAFLGAIHITYINNRFVVVSLGSNPLTNQQFQQSNLGDCTGWSALAFDLADVDSDPLLAAKGYKNILYLLGSLSIEMWSNVGAGPPGVLWNRIPASTMQSGIAATRSIAEMGDAGFALLAASRRGQAYPALLTGQGLSDIGTADLVDAINGYVSVADAVGASVQVAKHRFYILTFPAAGRTWVWDDQTGLWSEWMSYTPAAGNGQFRGLLAEQFNGATLLTDYGDGTVYTLSTAAYEDSAHGAVGGSTVPLVWQLVSGGMFSGARQLVLDAVQFDMEEGCGLSGGQGVNPVAMLEISRDKGRTWGQPVTAAIGKQGHYADRVIFRRLGRGRDLRARLTISDPIRRVITGEVVVLS